MATDFAAIALSKEELEALNLLDRHCLIAEDNEAKEEVKRLIYHELAEYFRTSLNGKPRIGVHLTDRGKDYLMYLKREKKKQRTQSIRYWITTGIAVAAWITAIVSIILQYL